MDRLMRHGRNLALAGAAAALALGTTACSSGDGGAAFRANVALSQPDQVMDALPSPAALPSGRLAPARSRRR
ncbi:hypothetical protein ACFQ0M_03460 [Kitasatospora aburaviensis]